MTHQLELEDYRDLINLDTPVVREPGSVYGIDPMGLPTIADSFAKTPYPSAPSTSLWQGDITTLAADAIVNAANAGLRGCSIPNHPCIDWAITQRAGHQIIADCQRIIQRQGHPEVAGQAKITRGYNLPSRFVLHTVGPIVRGELTPAHEDALASCYWACLELAAEVGYIRHVAFCAISTGVFGYPKREAAVVALQTVNEWLQTHQGVMDRVIFNVFSHDDRRVYERAIRAWHDD
ncbi:macro domain-containing protein [Stomatohabitans albus]|uniref:macro domain-containing protein n=1 Tax=Stomatohabitans albus TaxID=3110766 RepID=UPI00300D5A9C